MPMQDILWNYALNYWTWTSQTTIGQNNFSISPNKCHMWWTFKLSRPIPMNRVTQNHWHLILIYFYRMIECDGFLYVNNTEERFVSFLFWFHLNWVFVDINVHQCFHIGASINLLNQFKQMCLQKRGGYKCSWKWIIYYIKTYINHLKKN